MDSTRQLFCYMISLFAGSLFSNVVWISGPYAVERRIVSGKQLREKPENSMSVKNMATNTVTDSKLQEIIDDVNYQMEGSRPHCVCTKPHHRASQTLDLKRRTEALEFQKDWRTSDQPLTLCKAMLPINYIGNGIQLEPLNSVPIVGISFSEHIVFSKTRWKLSIKTRKKLGVVFVSLPASNSEASALAITGNFSGEMYIEAVTLSLLNQYISNLVYRSQEYVIDARDSLEVNFLNYTTHINIHIKKHSLSFRYPIVRGNVSEKVTVITKTFERYEAVHRLVNSVHQLYDKLTIIVADDSEKPVKINKPYVKHYTMPYLEGYFAGRNLALSQVTTEYVMYVDDDVFFTSNTKLESLIEKMEHTNSKVDLVAAAITGYRNNSGHAHLMSIAYSADGMCYQGVRKTRTHQYFPQCQWTELSLNVFIARTNVLRSIGFDANTTPFNGGHIEFWIDALGKSQSIFCRDVSVGHDDKLIGNEKYELIRSKKQESHPKNIMLQNNMCSLLYLGRQRSFI
ncbi:beta-1,4 N-acetylgalactosaminyltransferase 1-like [Saccoglossus kowalevskii]|uniref:Beta-1,4 N-acetylgalactosaminyltransferase 1-like n=1 Tax=Saccoglossus kowalevskii TaxID=10224 RepID=A0ABM0GJH8_SACKO|nr:PREDICTED: beta-1,4 N-acetylgalactosaminyltransferase 1-like [Saccoglossus kowalevskii]